MAKPSNSLGIVLVTGLSGFTGKYLRAALEDAGWRVIGLDAMQGKCSDGESVVCDLLDPVAVRNVVTSLNPQAVIHLAGISAVTYERKDQIYLVNIVGTRNLLEALAGLSQKPRNVILASSANVYGNASGSAIDEKTPPAPTNDYAVSKLAMEYLAKTYSEKLALTIVRPFNYTGRGQTAKFVVPKIVDAFRNHIPVLELGNLNVTREFSDVRRVADAYTKLSQLHGICETYNISSGHGVTLQEVIDICSRLTGHSLEIRINPAFVRENEVKILVGSGTKLERAVGGLKVFSIEDTLAWMLGAEK